MRLDNSPTTPNTITMRPDILTSEDIANYEGQETDENGSMNYSEILKNLNISGGEKEQDVKPEIKITEPEQDIFDTRISGIPERRSKRLTKTNPIIRFNNPITLIDYRKQPRAKDDGERRGLTGSRR